MKNILSVIGYFLFNVLVVGLFFIMVGLCISLLKSCNAEAAERTEWKCCAKPPCNTRYRNDINVCAFNEDRMEAGIDALSVCDKLFNAKCEIEFCKQVKARQ